MALSYGGMPLTPRYGLRFGFWTCFLIAVAVVVRRLVRIKNLVLDSVSSHHSETSEMTFEHVQQRDGRWALVGFSYPITINNAGGSLMLPADP